MRWPQVPLRVARCACYAFIYTPPPKSVHNKLPGKLLCTRDCMHNNLHRLLALPPVTSWMPLTLANPVGVRVVKMGT